MKTILSITTISAASLLAVSPLLAQAPVRPSSAGNKAPDTAPVSPDAKEKAEDAALLQELEAGAKESNNGLKQPPRQRAKSWLAPDGKGTGGAGLAGVAQLDVPYRIQNLLTRPVGEAASPLLVRTAEPDPKAQAALEEDLSVMAHILDKAIQDLPGGQRHAMTALGIDVAFTPGSMPMRSLYLDNYGAVFFLGVSFPLVAPPEKHQEEKPAADSAWEDARQELYGQRLEAAVVAPAEEYSQGKVNKLKETLLETLKNAANIRDLKPDEFVTLWVSGGADRARVVRKSRVALGGDATVNEFRLGDAFVANPAATPAYRTVMTIRVSKADIDTYAKSKLSPEEFEKRAHITTYIGNAAGGASDGVVVKTFPGRPSP